MIACRHLRIWLRSAVDRIHRLFLAYWDRKTEPGSLDKAQIEGPGQTRNTWPSPFPFVPAAGYD